jgi:hypothetical protein
MYKPNTGHLSTQHKRKLLKLPNGKQNYIIFVMYCHFLKGLRHICVEPKIENSESFMQKLRGLDCDSGEKPLEKVKCLSGFLETIQRQRIKNVDELMAEVQRSHEQRVRNSNINMIIRDDRDALSEIMRKLKFPPRTGIDYFDNHTSKVAGQKLDKLNKVIPPETMAQLTDLEIPFPFESELPQEPVVSVPELQPVSEATIRSELSTLSRFILSALFALLTKTGITPVHTRCDNQRYEGCFKDLRRRIAQMMSGEIPPNQETHWDAQHCRDHHGCPSCRALCAMMTILRYPSNPNIGKQICRCVWHGSIFAELAMRHFLILTLGPTCALAQVVNNPESPHRAMLIELLTEMGVQETPEEKGLREQQDAAVKQLELSAFRDHDHVEDRINDAFCRHEEFIYGLGYDPRITGSI